MHILIAPNAFKNSLNATDAALAIGKGLEQSQLKYTCTYFPVGDGGDGTAELILQHCNSTFAITEVHDPLGRKITASIALIDEESTAIIEMADASGLRLLNTDELDPLHASTFGTGELMKFALEKGARKIILGIGGSATVDGGVGLLKALGVRFQDGEGRDLSGMPESLVDLVSIDISGLDKRMVQCELIVLCDVENTLLGKNGAAKVFGPQKGALEEDIKKFEAALTQLRDVTLKKTGFDMATFKHGGAAGGTAAGLASFLHAKLVNGIEYFLQVTGFDDALKNANFVITGEGSVDSQTLQGKGPFGVARKAKEKNIRVIALSGKVPLETDQELDKYFDVLLSIGHEPSHVDDALQVTAANLERTAKAIGKLLAM